ncbi:methyl-accepting chemotaxis protein [Neopusillimonas aromaticivorans]|uniref:methyl-accepting chemotaxis protein n=1 Tax=Neopusillimonas aromaticivorans TaxID=2979868 RepID=UPI002599797D|nr:methyl-accepting chemotaxis protein [Neopusillimonas aromaticivorans]WJJ93054.1 methyl-accepting chemotaxis protein [Neopusillimonas aromaticivorans]
MRKINESSERISEIVGIIDSIAFQTNILALNAAVEAARAGEAGRGFAVVASEVRALAQRSSSAANEVKTLINDSVDKVTIGNAQVENAGQRMSEIVQNNDAMTSLVQEISNASQEQSIGLQQINQAITAMDEMIQKNVSLVSDTTEATKALREQASELHRSVSVFKIGHEGHGQQNWSAPRAALGHNVQDD